MSEQTPEKPFVSELFEDLAERYKSPKPEALATDVQKFEHFLTGILLPFVGVNAFVCGSLFLLNETGSALLLLALVAVQLLAWSRLFPLQRYRAAWLHVGGVATVILMALLTVPSALLAVLLGFAWSMLLVLAIGRRFVREHTAILYVAYLPWVASTELAAGARIAFEMVTILPMAALFVILGFRIAGGAALLTTVVVGVMESSRLGQGDVGVVVLMLLSLVLAVGYEWRLRKVPGSALKEFLGQGLPALVGLVFANSLFDSGSSVVWWVWAYCVAGYQLLQCIRERFASPIRTGWIALALTLCIWTQTPELRWELRAAMALGIAAALYCVAVYSKRAFLASLSLLMAAVPAATLITYSQGPFSVPVLVIGALTVWFLLLAAGTRPEPEAIPWTRGFIRAEQAHWLRGFFLGALAQLLRIPLIGTLFDWARRIFIWLNYTAGGGKGLTLADLTFAAANFIGAVVASNQLMALLSVPGKSETDASLRLLALSSVFIPWGLAVVIAGNRRADLFHRVVGTALLAFPGIAQLTYVASGNRIAIDLLVVLTGLGMWLAATAARRPVAEAQSASASTPQAGATDGGEVVSRLP